MTHSQSSTLSAIAVLAVQMFPSMVRAAPAPDVDTPTWPDAPTIGLGAAIGNRERPYKGLGGDTRVLPAFFYENSWIKVQGLGAALKLGTVSNATFGLNLDYSLRGYDASDAPILSGMDDRKGGFWIGPNVRWRNDLVNLSGGLSVDLSGYSKGTQARLSLDRTFRTGAFSITPRASAVWLDRKYVDYYYGVESSEARSDRPAYEGTSTVNIELGLRIGYMLTPRQTVILDLSTTRLGGSIKNSPLVDKSTQSGFRVGYIYRF